MYDKTKTPFVALQGTLYSTGRKSPQFEFKKKMSSLTLKCTLTNRKYKFSEYIKWWQSDAIQQYQKMGWELTFETKTQEPYKQPQYGDNIEQIVAFIMRQPYQQRTKSIDGMKPIGQAMPQYAAVAMTQAQPSAPDNAVPVTMQDHKKMPVVNEDSEPLDDEIPF